ncbi:hypothetical protein [Bittarella massiliensis (ex Durand et al. 2017)]|nr:hypothetical protein [Bittarella massiliensis (ex Durand et al. 2017)]
MEFQIEHHAALFAYLAREALQRCGVAGEEAVPRLLSTSRQ